MHILIKKATKFFGSHTFHFPGPKLIRTFRSSRSVFIDFYMKIAREIPEGTFDKRFFNFCISETFSLAGVAGRIKKDCLNAGTNDIKQSRHCF